jgi:hypothetical protein
MNDKLLQSLHTLFTMPSIAIKSHALIHKYPTRDTCPWGCHCGICFFAFVWMCALIVSFAVFFSEYPLPDSSAWGSAELSEERECLAGTALSIKSLALFAGGAKPLEKKSSELI